MKDRVLSTAVQYSTVLLTGRHLEVPGLPPPQLQQKMLQVCPLWLVQEPIPNPMPVSTPSRGFVLTAECIGVVRDEDCHEGTKKKSTDPDHAERESRVWLTLV